jgi:predicted glycogen debranching enzyme
MQTTLPGQIRFGREICGDLGQAERREWWLANGLGAYAAGTIAGTLTRRYHGLLIAPVYPPLGRMLVFAKADATLVDGEQTWPLFSNRWGGGAISPAGHVHIESFELDGRLPLWRYAVGSHLVEQRIWLEPGANTTYVAYRLQPDGLNLGRTLQLHIKLLFNARDHHGQTQPGELQPRVESDGGWARVTLGDRIALTLQAAGGVIAPAYEWINNFDLPVERERGLPDRDNHLCVGEARLTLTPGVWTGVVASLHADASADIGEALARARAYEAAVLARAKASVKELADAPAWVDQLVLAADSFVFARPLADVPDGESVIAGYPWFGDWGRDTMIALPGLTLATGRADSARRILQTFARFVDRGMLPNVFPGAGETPEYNTVDAALWYIEAWRAYVEATGDDAALRRAFPVLQQILEGYRTGTRYSIHMDSADALVYAGERGVQLTWMDAKVGDWVITPRIGKPVEINALWYNAHEIMHAFANRLRVPAGDYRQLAARIRWGFRRFVRADGGGLFDVLDGPGGDDATLRPNQIFAVSLPHSPLDADTQARIVAICARHLFSSYGLRSLAPTHPDFRPVYQGDVWARDSAYHQGPVWGWLLGHYALAHHRVYGDATGAQRYLEPVRDHLRDAGLGTISEIFDGAAPHTPRGCPAQAWSVACVLEAWLRLQRAQRRADKPERVARRTGQRATRTRETVV